MLFGTASALFDYTIMPQSPILIIKAPPSVDRIVLLAGVSVQLQVPKLARAKVEVSIHSVCSPSFLLRH